MQYKILLMGPQGSGKGTQAELLSEKLSIPAMSMGQLLRNEIAAKSEMGQKVESILAAGELVSDEDAAEVLKARIAQPGAEGGYVLDGYPRNAAQMAAFNFDVPTHVVVLEIPREESMKRLGGRLTCSSTNKVYRMDEGHKSGDACEDGGELFVREDDRPEAIERRLEIYENDTAPIVSEYEAQGFVHRIDGVGTVEEIFDRILSVLNT